jgi:hypothetical protein
MIDKALGTLKKCNVIYNEYCIVHTETYMQLDIRQHTYRAQNNMGIWVLTPSDSALLAGGAGLVRLALDA